MQPYFFPYLGYWQLINAVDKYVIYDDVNFINRSFINRNYILLKDNPKRINLQLKEASQNKLINEVEISQDRKWKDDFLKTLSLCYQKAPYYLEVFPIIQGIINYEDSNLAKYLEHSIREVCKYLSIDTEILLSSAINKDNSLRGQDKILSICQVMGALEYYNAIGGVQLYSQEAFSARGIKLNFLKSHDIHYAQFNENFISRLSIIDVLMFNSKEKVSELLKEYELINSP